MENQALGGRVFPVLVIQLLKQFNPHYYVSYIIKLNFCNDGDTSHSSHIYDTYHTGYW